MKEKIIKFLVEKKEIFIFVGVLLVVLGTVLGISFLAGGKAKEVSNTSTDGNSTTNTTKSQDTSTTTLPPIILERMILPIEGEYEIVRYYFCEEDKENMPDAIIVSDNQWIESNGISYSKKDNSKFDVLAVFSGTVLSVQTDEKKGTIVSIKHDCDVVSTYYSLESTELKVNDYIKIGDVIGVSGSSKMDEDAGIHVHLELKKNNSFINPLKAIDKELNEISVVKEK